MPSISVHGYDVDIYMPKDNSDHLAYLHASREEGAAVWQLLSDPKPALAVISGVDWNRDFSPWPAARLFSNGEDFSGGSDVYLSKLTGRIIPEVEAVLPAPVKSRCLAGYSLAGLFALWCVYRCDIFDGIAALSPSAWYDGFADFALANPISEKLKCIFLSLGDREKHTRNPRMKEVENALSAITEYLKSTGVHASFHFEHGGHFDDVPGRIARGIAGIYIVSRL